MLRRNDAMNYAWLGLSVLLSLPASAQNNNTANSGRLETILVTATRTESDIADTAATVSVLTEQDIERQLARDIRDLIRYEPGVSVGGTGDRFGLGGFTIRGIGGNRVLTLIDGVRVADAYGFGPFLSANRNYVDIDSVKSFEIVRGPGSALYGSDAIGGIVAYRTKDALDYLAGDPFYAGVKLGHSSADDSSVATITLAGGNDALSGSLIYSHRAASETDNRGEIGGTGPGRELPDPLERRSDNVVTKLTFAPSEMHALTFGAELFDSNTDTDLLSNYGVVSGSAETLTQQAHDETERTRVNVGYTYTPTDGAIDRLHTQFYAQKSKQSQHTRESRLSLGNGSIANRARDSYFDQDIDGLSLQLDKRIDGGNTRHFIVAGADYWRTDSASIRDGGTTDPASGAAIPEFLPLPTRDFPPTSIDQFGIFVQDEISLLDDRLSITPSLRFDSFDAEAHADAVYYSGNPGQAPPENFDDSELSPKVGLLYALTDRLSLYAQYAEGFKAPPYDDVNVGFTNPIGGYKTISNADLESEQSVAHEIGLRVNTSTGQLSIVAFQNRYDNFIESFLPAPQFAATFGVDPADGFFTFQSQNLDRVEIDGLEISGRLGLSQNSPFAVRLSLAYAEGKEAASGTPLDSIDPVKAVVGLNYAAPSERWGGDLMLTLVAGKRSADIAASRYATAGYGLVDVLGFYRIREKVRINFGLFNIGNRDYIEWADTAAIAYDPDTNSYPELRRFTRPGFNAGISLRAEF
jgi:hemoglobin/transferrin/lactoferrin receptor protein